jgi:hypothetical protein
MKQFFSLLSLSLCLYSYATVRTVSNNPNTVAQYSTIQAAVDASASGDTIYVQGSSTAYAAFTITDKRLTVIGPGLSPVRGFQPLKAIVPSITFQGAGSDFSEIQGLVITAQVVSGFNHPNNLHFFRNQFSGQVIISYGTGTYTGYVFQDNWFDNGSIVGNSNNSYSNCIFQNNIFYNASSVNGNVSSLVNCNNVVFDHNLWYGPSSGSSVCFAGACSLLMLTNNIFVHRNASSNCFNTTFNNNITFNTDVTAPWSLNGNLNGGGNVANQDPQMVDQASVNNGTNDPLLNFTIAAGPANNTSTDGKDMGLLFDAGLLNWTSSRMSRLPYIYSMSITNPVIAAGGTLSVQVEARKSN